MKNEMRLYLIWILVLANLLYDEYWGLNTLIIAGVTVVVLWYRNFIKGQNPADQQAVRNDIFWYFGAAIWLISATGVFLLGGWFQVLMYMLSMGYFIALQDRKPVSVPVTAVQTLQSFATGLARIFMDSASRLKNEETIRSRKVIRQIMLFFIGLIICIAFLKLYQMADADFYELTKFINLDWISWGFIFFYFFLAWLLYGLYFFKSEPEITKLDNHFGNDINPDYTDSVQKFFGITQERNLAMITLGVLNLMLILLLVLDVRFLMTEYGTDKPVAEFSSVVHQGVNALIFSLVLVMLLISFFFRGSLNFEKNKGIKLLAVFWLIANCVLVFTTGAKNFDYIAEFGFTYKRLGVLLYLFLCGVGLVFSIYKIIHVRSVWFLIRNTSLAFIFVFALVSLFNWNQIIAKYNLDNVQKSRLDLEYLFELGPDSYPDLIDYHLENKINNTGLFYNLVNASQSELYAFDRRAEYTTWRSFTLRDHLLYEKLNRYKFEYSGTQSREYSASF